MKDILYKKRCNSKERTKIFSVLQKTEDPDCVTTIRKAFRYEVFAGQKENVSQLEAPQVYIRKVLNTRKSLEKFTFKVHGTFYLTHKESLLRVDFQHTLNIHLAWKSKLLSPQKSELLT